MRVAPVYLRRRSLLAGTAAVVINLIVAPYARAATGVAALDTQALAVKNPTEVLLVAITLTPGNRLVAVGEHGVVIYSDDNGTSWTQASVSVNVTLTCIAFTTAEIGWAAGHFGVVLNTQDGGKSWQEQLNGLQANQLTVQAAQGPSVASGPSPGAPLAARRAQHFMEGGPDNPFLTMQILGPQKLIVFGAYRMTMLSNDGGKTWQDWSLHIFDKYGHNFYSVAGVDNAYYLVGEEGLVFNSTDGCNSFLPLTSPGSSTLFGILGGRDASLIIFGVAGFAARSTDQGKTWSALTIATQEDLTGGRVLASGSIVLVDEAGAVFESADNGATFAHLQGIQPAPFFDVQQTPDGGLVAVGAAGITQIAKSLLAS